MIGIIPGSAMRTKHNLNCEPSVDWLSCYKYFRLSTAPFHNKVHVANHVSHRLYFGWLFLTSGTSGYPTIIY